MVESKFVKLLVEGKEIEFLIFSLIVGLDVMDICKFYGQVDVFIYDFGFILIVFCDLVIIFIDGDKGELWYCGYLIE